MLDTLLFALLYFGDGARAGVDPKLGYITADDSEFEGHEGDFFKFVSVSTSFLVLQTRPYADLFVRNSAPTFKPLAGKSTSTSPPKSPPATGSSHLTNTSSVLLRFRPGLALTSTTPPATWSGAGPPNSKAPTAMTSA